ncbi:MAG: hypothetical protein HY900_03985 [Deltaproteobacteria bacterium]|nr:hypothetical protein [Deltaproteobacteria bacterium]
MRILTALAVSAALAGFVAPAASACGGEKENLGGVSFPAGDAVSERGGPSLRVVGDVDLGDRFVGADGQERGAGGFESHAVDLDREEARAAHDAR